MKILSIDVGMKNLAFCLFYIKDSMEFEILKWDVLNLCEEKEYLCKELKKDGKQCNKKAKYFKKGKYYCKTHAKNKKYQIPDSKCNKYNIKKKNVIDLRKLVKNFKIETKKKPLKKDLLNILTDYFDSKFFDIVSKTKTKDMNLVSYGRNMRKLFNKTLEKEDIDIVCVENQIGPLALRMKTLQGMIMQHFIELEVPLVEEVSATNKLKDFLDLKKTTYSERKKLSIKYTEDILVNNNNLHKWIKVFSEHKKKDDLADSFLQGRWYLKNSILKNNK